jgi:hypothetical protein
MLHPVEKSLSAVRNALHAVRELVHPTTVMKDHAFDRPTDDMGQTINDADLRMQPPERPEQKH